MEGGKLSEVNARTESRRQYIHEALFHRNVINLVVFPFSWVLSCVQLGFPFLKPHIYHYQVMLPAEVDENLASLISFTKSKRS